MKNKKKLSESELKLILVMLALLLLAGAYFLIYRQSVSKAVELEAQNEVDQETVTMLENMERRRAQVEAETEECKEIIQEVIAKYPSDVTTEKAITIAQNMEDFAGIHFPNLRFVINNLVLEFKETSEEIPTPPKGYYASMSMSYSVTYDGFKNLLTYVGGLKDRMTVPSVSASYDPTTDMLNGSITVHMYYLQDTGKEYVTPVIPGIEKGVESIFGAGDGIVPETADGEEGGEEGEAADEAEE